VVWQGVAGHGMAGPGLAWSSSDLVIHPGFDPLALHRLIPSTGWGCSSRWNHLTDRNHRAGYPPNWLSELRPQQLEFDNHRCRTCGITAKQLAELEWAPLQVHHCNEGPPHFAGPYYREKVGVNLMTLCPDCHDGITDSVRRQRYRLSPDKQVGMVVTERQESIGLQSADRPPVEIKVTDEAVQSERISSARRIEIRLFND